MDTQTLCGPENVAVWYRIFIQNSASDQTRVICLGKRKVRSCMMASFRRASTNDSVCGFNVVLEPSLGANREVVLPLLKLWIEEQAVACYRPHVVRMVRG